MLKNLKQNKADCELSLTDFDKTPTLRAQAKQSIFTNTVQFTYVHHKACHLRCNIKQYNQQMINRTLPFNNTYLKRVN